MAAWCGGEFVGPAELVADRLAQPQHRERDEILGQHFLLAAETATDASGEHVHLAAVEAEHVAQLVADQKRHLRTGANHQAPLIISPARAAVSFEVRVLDALGGPAPANDGTARLARRDQSGLDVADATVQLRDEVPRDVGDPRVGPLAVVHQRGTSRPRCLRIEHGG